MTEKDLLQPVKVFSSGPVYASIWRHAHQDLEGCEQTTYTVRIARRYRTDDGELAESPYVARDELPRLAAVAQAAYAWLTVEERPVSPGAEPPMLQRPSELYAAEPAR